MSVDESKRVLGYLYLGGKVREALLKSIIEKAQS